MNIIIDYLDERCLHYMSNKIEIVPIYIYINLSKIYIPEQFRYI